MPRTKKTCKTQDSPLLTNATIHAKASVVLGGSERARRVYGTICKEREVNGTVVEVVLRETSKGRMMKRILGRYQVGARTVIRELPLAQVVAGESKKYPLSIERKGSLGGQRTIATFVTPSKTCPPTTATAPVAPSVAAPATQMSATDSSSDDEPLINLKKRSNKNSPPIDDTKPPAIKPPPPPTQDAIILASDDETVEVVDVDAVPAPSTPSPTRKDPPQEEHTPVRPLHQPVEEVVDNITWTESVPVQLLNGGHHHHDWHHKTNVRGVHVCEGSDTGGLLSLKYYFDAVFPAGHLRNIVRWTNAELAGAYLRPTSEAEVIKFFGIILLIPRLPQVSCKRLWSTVPCTKYSCLPNLGKTGMSRDRFKHLLKNMRFSFQPKTQLPHVSNEGYAWMLIADFVDAINDWKSKRIYPGSIVCVDESIIRWYGLGGEYLNMGSPYYVCIDSKPDNGIEIQTSACAKSGILLQLKIVKSKSESKKENFVRHVPKEENSGTTAVKQLTQPWHRSNRVTVADSAFASVATALEMKRLGLGFVGCVKTASKGFPKEVLQQIQLSGRGDYFRMVAMKDNVKLLAFTWCDRDRQSFIATSGSLAKANAQERYRYRPVGPTGDDTAKVLVGVDLPLAAEMYYAGNGAINYHNCIQSKEVQTGKHLFTNR